MLKKTVVVIRRKEKNELLQLTNTEYMHFYKKKIADLVGQIEDVWILNTIHNFIVGMIKEGG